MKGKGRSAMFAGGGVALILVIVAGLILPKANQVRQRQKDLAQAQQKQQTLTLQLDQLKVAAKDFKKNQRELRILEQEVPETAQLPSIITLINAAADDSAVDFMSISPGVPTSGTSTSTIPTQISVIGEYFAVDEFLFKLESLSRVAKVTTITVGPNAASGSTSTASVTSTGPMQLKVDLMAEFYTTDFSAGPGSSPGHTDAAQLAPAAVPGVSPSPSPSGG